VYFLGSKTESLYFQRKNPRKIAWTVLYRRKHKKGLDVENKKRRTRRTQKFTRAIEVRWPAASWKLMRAPRKNSNGFF
jgi:large subunit ribosomal protein L24e